MILAARTIAPLGSSLLIALAVACGGDNNGDSTGADHIPTTTDAAEVAASSVPSGDRAALVVDEMTELATTQVEGYERKEPTTNPNNVTVAYDPVEGGSGLSSVVTLAPCVPIVCWDLSGEITMEHEQNLKSNLAPVHLENPDLVFEYGNIEIASGYEAFFNYSFSFVADEGSKAATNSYHLVYHDGTNLISIQVTPEFGPLPDSADVFQMEMDQSKGEMAARTFFAAYMDAFEPVQ